MAGGAEKCKYAVNDSVDHFDDAHGDDVASYHAIYVTHEHGAYHEMLSLNLHQF